jgi:hypothetical protein
MEVGYDTDKQRDQQVNTTRIVKLEKNGSRMSDGEREKQARGKKGISTRGRVWKT